MSPMMAGTGNWGRSGAPASSIAAIFGTETVCCVPFGVLTLVRLKPPSVKSMTTCSSLLETKVTSGLAGALPLMAFHCWANAITDIATNRREKNSFFMCEIRLVDINRLKMQKYESFPVVGSFQRNYFQLRFFVYLCRSIQSKRYGLFYKNRLVWLGLGIHPEPVGRHRRGGLGQHFFRPETSGAAYRGE